jgi:hypothetical protein
MEDMFRVVIDLSYSTRVTRRSNARRIFLWTIVFTLIVSAMTVSTGNPALAAQPEEVTFTVDNVTVTVRTPFLPRAVPKERVNNPFVISPPGESIQMALASAPDPRSSFAIHAVPFGTQPSSLPVPIARPGGAKTYLEALREARKSYETEFEPNGPVATLFGHKAAGQVTLVAPQPGDVSTRSAIAIEWAVEAGQRLWVVRITSELPQGQTLASSSAFLQSLTSLDISSDTLDNPTTVAAGRDAGAAAGGPGAGTSDSLPGMPRTGLTNARSLLLDISGAIAMLLFLVGMTLRYPWYACSLNKVKRVIGDLR